MATKNPLARTTRTKARQAKTVDDVIARMKKVRDELDPADGVACFNRMYLRVTELIKENLTQGFFADPAFVDRLDVIFANIYFQNIDAVSSGQKPDQAWEPLFDSRDNRIIWPIQFALAGMNAHINHDLPIAVVATCKEFNKSPNTAPVYDDYVKVNDLLAKVESEVRRSFETQLVKVATKDAELLKHAVGSVSISGVREAAWGTVEALWTTQGAPSGFGQFSSDGSVTTLSHGVGTAGRAILIPVVPPPAQ